MKNVRLKVNLGGTINIGNFENVKVDVGLDADIPDDSNINEKYDEIFQMLEEQIQSFTQNRLRNVSTTFRNR